MKNMDTNIILEIIEEWYQAMEDAEKHYMKMMELGATPQIARSVLPNSTKTEITITANYREWRNFFKLRIPLTAHPQMREVTIPLLKEFKEIIPIVFDDIEVE
jgi:thymidylate synthase (FAD)